jgi:hypothetical protein
VLCIWLRVRHVREELEKRLREQDWLVGGRRLGDMNDFYNMVREREQLSLEPIYIQSVDDTNCWFLFSL